MHPNIESAFRRADELIGELRREYESALRNKQVTGRAKELTNEVAEKLRHTLDRVARRYWEVHVSPFLSEKDRNAASIYFPVAKKREDLDSVLGRWRWAAVRDRHQPLIQFFAAKQPYSNAENDWLRILNEIAVQKHIDLVEQSRSETKQTTVHRIGGGSVSWTSGVTFGAGVSVMGAPIDPRTQRIEPTPGVIEKIDVWVSFHIAPYNIESVPFLEGCRERTHSIAQEMADKFKLS